MDNNDEDFINYNIKKKKSKRTKNALKYSKTCAVYGIFDCTCCKKDENDDRVVDSVIDETINQPSTSTSTSRLSTNEDDAEQNLSDDLFDDDFIDVGTDYIPTTTNVSSDKLENSSEDISDNLQLDEKPENILDYINTVCKETGYEEEEDSEINILNEINLIQSDETINVSMDAQPATTSDPLTTDETNANASIKSDVLLVTEEEEEEEEIDVVNIPADDTQNNLIENSNNHTETVQQEITQNNFKTELSDDENQIIDILNFDNTDLREDLVNNIENSVANMESTSNTNEDEIIDVENLNEETPAPPPPQNNESDPIVRRLRRNQLKRRVRSQITINFRKRPRMLRSVMTIDLINSPRDNSIIEITDSPVVPRKVTEVINVDDDEYEEPNLNTTYSPRRVGLGNCPVCLESLAKKEIMSTICGHVYCSRCIKNVIKTTKKCPNCRKNLTLKSIHPLFI